MAYDAQHIAAYGPQDGTAQHSTAHRSAWHTMHLYGPQDGTLQPSQCHCKSQRKETVPLIFRSNDRSGHSWAPNISVREMEPGATIYVNRDAA
eukprot:1148467-Pelagomonas_calceolata.AAC.4